MQATNSVSVSVGLDGAVLNTSQYFLNNM